MPRSPNSRRAKTRWRDAARAAARVASIALLGAAAVCGNASAETRAGQLGVVLMIGGMGDVYTRDSHASTAVGAPRSSRLSVVIQPGVAQPFMRVTDDSPTPSVASRVLALTPLIDEAARAADLDSALLMAVVDVESGGDPLAVSPKGATGLMQVMPDTGAQRGATNLFDPRQNLAAGARYLRQLMRQFGDLPLALAAYNAGEGAVQKYGGQIPPYAETLRYVPKVMGRYRRYRNATQRSAPDESDVPPLAQDAVRGRFLLVREVRGNSLSGR